jgi:alkylation response protein AidB-like acyl-CoA dehydrogenase
MTAGVSAISGPLQLLDDESVATARDLAPELAERAEEAERLERLPDENIDALETSGILGATIPRSFGGLQASPGAFGGVLEELARGCASTSFVASVYLSAAYAVSLFPDEAQADVFLSGNSRTILALNPGGGIHQTGEGAVLSGRWPFCSGQHHAGWGLVTGLTTKEDGTPDVGFFLVPRSEFQAANDWQVTGLAATGSNTLTLDGTVVPPHRMLLLSDLEAGRFESSLVQNDPYYQTPLLAFTAAGLAGTPLGIAVAALDHFAGRMSRRGITYSQYTCQAEAAITHFQMAEASMKLDEARFHAQRLVQTAEHAQPDLDLQTRARCRADLAWTVRLCREVTDIVQIASGASAIHRRDPLQRIIRDMQALSVHSLMLANTNAELYGRILCGQDPGIPFV